MRNPQQYGKEQCCCGHKGCTTWWLTGIGSFSQGSGFEEHEADKILSALNNEKRLTEAVQYAHDQGFEWPSDPFAAPTPSNIGDAEAREAWWLTQLREYATPDDADSAATAALKKAARTITQMDQEKVWCTSDVRDALDMIAAALTPPKATCTPPVGGV